MDVPKLSGLVLSRKKDEDIVIGTDIIVRVVELVGDKVRLLVSAPDAVPIHRREVFERIKAGETFRCREGKGGAE